QHVGGHLAPSLRHLDVLELEDDRAIRIADLARGEPEGEGGIRRFAGFGITPLDPHCHIPKVEDKRPRGRDLPRSSSAQIIVRRPNDPFLRIATRDRPSYGLLQTPRVARQPRCRGTLTLTLGRFQPSLSGRLPVSDRYPGKLVVLRALRQELVSQLSVPTIYS